MSAATREVGVSSGDVVAGKYRIDHVLGTGGMGVVVAARHLQLDERVALKLLVPEAASNPLAVARFAREARAAAKIKSEHVARVSDVGCLESGAPYMVMEYLEGEDLGARLQTEGRLGVPLAVALVLQACEAVAEAHTLGIIHRDLKPSNLFCARLPDGSESIKVLDFGISRVPNVEGATPDGLQTTTASVVGSPHYMSPEQMQSPRTVDARSDLWAMGVILFELVTGQRPFDGESLPELALQVAIGSPRPIRELFPEVPAALERVIRRCLRKAPDDRFNDVAALADALQPLASPAALISIERIRGIAGQPRAEGLPVARDKRRGIAIALAVAIGAMGLLASTQLRATGEGDAAVAARPPERSPPPTTAPHAETVAAAEPLADTPLASSAVANGGPSSASSALLPAPVRNVPAASQKATATRVPAPPPSTTSATALVAPSPPPDCSPPYFIDPAGHKRYKAECF